MHTDTQPRTGRSLWSHGWVLGVLLGLFGYWQPCQAADYTCTSTSGVGDVACLINAINAANANGEANTIRLAAGIYTLTTVNNNTVGPNGLPADTGLLTITGVGAALPSSGAGALRRPFSSARPVPRRSRARPVAEAGRLALEGAGPAKGRTLAAPSATARRRRPLQQWRHGHPHSEHARPQSAGGGGIFNWRHGHPHQSTLAHNSAGVIGGGLANVPDGTVTITESTIDRQLQPAIGGGLYNGGTVTLTQSTLAHNRRASSAAASTMAARSPSLRARSPVTRRSTTAAASTMAARSPSSRAL